MSETKTTIKERAEESAENILYAATGMALSHYPLENQNEIVEAVEYALRKERRIAMEDACGIVYGMCSSDNAAQRTVDKIRKLLR